MRPTFFVLVALLTASVADAQEPRQRWPDSSSQSGSGEATPSTAVPRNDPPPQPAAPPPPPAPSQPATAPAPRASAPARATAGNDGQRTAQPRQRRPPESEAGRVAVPRGSVPPPTTVYVPPQVYNNYYYYPRRYYPYGYGAFGLGYFYYDPYSWYPYDYGSSRFSGYGYGYPTGELRLRVRPRQAEVYVDGYYAGQVDDFDGILQSLTLEAGPYAIELVAPGYEPLEFDVRIQPGRKITYRGELRPLRP